jgi:sugar phosphate isomerase/epimerase
LHPDAAHRQAVAAHLKKVMNAAAALGLPVVNTFIGRDHTRSITDNWALMLEVWRPLIKHAESCGILIGIENCPMLFTNDEWPGGKNLAVSPHLWRRIFTDLGSEKIGLNLDPSHLIWLHIDYARCIRDFASRIVHVHAKDTRIDHDKLYEHGILGLGWHTPKIPGLGDVNWGQFFSALTDTGYNGPVCIEVEDRAFEGSLDDRKRSLRLSKKFLDQFVG